MLRKSLVLATVGLIAIAGLAGCRRGAHLIRNPEKRVEWIVNHISKELDLNDAQKAKLKIMAQDIKAKHKAMRAENAQNFDQFTAQIRKDKLDMNVINSLIDKKHETMQQIRPFALEKLTEFHAMLTPEQRNKLADKMEKFHQEDQQ